MTTSLKPLTRPLQALRSRPRRSAPDAAPLSALLVSVLLLSGCSDGLTLDDPRIRWLPGERPMAGYFRLKNATDAPQTLTGAKSRAFAEVSLHRSRQENGMSTMAPVSEVTLAPGEALAFEPGGYHLMMRQRTRSVKVGDRIAVELVFANGKSLTGQFAVEAMGGSQ